ncbi:hypothetical protein [Anianabacter salinae]|uniref:hypothetical protein n=1 Tax=Anianabacter salinae TaxID=2851023 RepID=UPI00225DD1BF|nr:hypothetical protein [Anianabacter salinae]MBV0912140.1 hypothetical protein [Anianabacter salinae]
MQWTRVEANWAAFVDPILQTWPDADEDEIASIDGDREAFTDYIATVEQIERIEAQEQIAEWLEGAIPSDVRMDEEMDAEGYAESRKHLMEGEDPSDDDAKFGDDQTPETPIGRRD